MPHQQGSRNHQQRRVFRGRCGPTDGNLPPKKSARPKVKYQAAENQAAADGRGRQRAGEVEDETAVESDQENEKLTSDRNIQQLSLDEVGDPPLNDKLSLEIQHLHNRIQNVLLSLQTSQGLSNPKKWRTNCLLPVKKVVKEWRSILLFHYSDDTNQNKRNEDEDDETLSDHDSENNNGIGRDVTEVLHSTSQKVFGLIQMTMQTGPLLGSNPGYFKRCGGEVASMAFEFLCEIVELADVHDKIGVEDKSNIVIEKYSDLCSGQDGAFEVGLEESVKDHQTGELCEQVLDSDCNSNQSVDSDDDSPSVNDFSSSSTQEEVDKFPEANAQSLGSLEAPSKDAAQVQIINNLQHTLLFTEKQSQRFYQWRSNAARSADKNKPPSKSAKKLQNHKSKKQKQKELKMERKIKKKKKMCDK